jgi:phage shock protein PspC (stress-responsive transcriptional regulator)
MDSPTHTPLDTPLAPPEPRLAPPAPLRRRATHRLVAGVAGGLADYYRTRPIWLRIGFALSGIYMAGLLTAVSSDPFHQFSLSDFGLGLIVSILALAGAATYLLVWWLVPREDLPESAVEPRSSALGSRSCSTGSACGGPTW